MHIRAYFNDTWLGYFVNISPKSIERDERAISNLNRAIVGCVWVK